MHKGFHEEMALLTLVQRGRIGSTIRCSVARTKDVAAVLLQVGSAIRCLSRDALLSSHSLLGRGSGLACILGSRAG